eukprot:CAMPEP_0172366206 /NCGR_PEP_ID=MMETSP1060-20121228/14167_1 /TAXON_ID=37318 /ORGANISM="Pseudo-nitzschia pungens, Strain cf. cingulata" /LENGTH=467 /DNA_ID=CAMNT_0013089957 /DNA_START=44 /DNA_END=1450 /DNA_ORIENTATION=-
MAISVVRFFGLSILSSCCVLLLPFDQIGVASGLSYARTGSSLARTRNSASAAIVHRIGSGRLDATKSPSTADVDPMSQTQTDMSDDLPWRDTNSSPLSGKELQSLVVQAALLEEFDEDENDLFLDVPGVAWLEHINLIVGETSEDRSIAEAFYLEILGMTADKGKSFHVNLGRQQFHLATPKRDDEVAHRIHGSVGLAVPDLETLSERLRLARKDQETNNNYGFRGTLFDFYEEQVDGSKIVNVRCPWGNVFRCYSAGDRGSSPLVSEIEESPQKMTTLHSPQLGLHGSDKMGVLSVGQPGIRFVELICPEGVSAHQICAFYKTMLKCPSRVLSVSERATNCCVVSVGAGVQLVFVEGSTSQTAGTSDSNPQHLMKGVHICIYAHDFRQLYDRLSSKSLIWTNPRFIYLDSCDTWEEAKKSRTLRFRHIVDVEDETTGDPKVLMELEHETRPLRHGQFMKVPYYVPK